MRVEIRAAAERDLPAMVECWNGEMVHDRLSVEELRRAVSVCGDAFVAAAGETMSGLALTSAAREEPCRGRIVAICAGSADLVADLLARAEAHLREQGAQRITVGEFGGCNLAPGIDVRYDMLNAAFAEAGYTHVRTLDDMELDLADYRPTPYQERCRARAVAHGAQVVDWSPDLVPGLLAFKAAAAGVLPSGWFWNRWEYGPHMVVATKGVQVVGYANYGTDLRGSCGRYHRPNAASFGPIGVLEEHRGQGIGTWLLSEACLRVQAAGRRWLWAGWTNTPFYAPSGWQVCRRYNVWERG